MIVFGKNKQILFENEAEQYKFIGYLANHDAYIQWEPNEGAWAQEGRIAFTTNNVKKYFPNLGYTAGLANTYSCRLNCNPFVEILFNLGFDKGNQQNIALIKSNIDVSNQYYFDIGYNL